MISKWYALPLLAGMFAVGQTYAADDAAIGRDHENISLDIDDRTESGRRLGDTSRRGGSGRDISTDEEMRRARGEDTRGDRFPDRRLPGGRIGEAPGGAGAGTGRSGTRGGVDLKGSTTSAGRSRTEAADDFADDIGAGTTTSGRVGGDATGVGGAGRGRAGSASAHGATTSGARGAGGAATTPATGAGGDASGAAGGANTGTPGPGGDATMGVGATVGGSTGSAGATTAERPGTAGASAGANTGSSGATTRGGSAGTR